MGSLHIGMTNRSCMIVISRVFAPQRRFAKTCCKLPIKKLPIKRCSKSATKSLKNAPKRARKCLSPVRLQRVFHRHLFTVFHLQFQTLVAKCSATRHTLGARQGFGGPVHLRHPSQASGMECDRALLGGVAGTPLLHIGNSRMSRDRGVATPWSATEGGCSVCAT